MLLNYHPNSWKKETKQNPSWSDFYISFLKIPINKGKKENGRSIIWVRAQSRVLKIWGQLISHYYQKNKKKNKKKKLISHFSPLQRGPYLFLLKINASKIIFIKKIISNTNKFKQYWNIKKKLNLNKINQNLVKRDLH